MRNLLFTSLLITLFLTACGGPNEADFKSDVPERPSLEQRIVNQQGASELTELATEVNLGTPFFPQAPEGNWDQPWQDACEESSVILAHYGMKGETLTLEEFKAMVLEMVTWENEHFGYYESTTLAQVQELYENFFDDAFKVKIIESPTVDDLKEELTQGHLIVAPFAGRELKNPFYSGEGPYYHMMVIKGYDASHFITQDVGTRRGENFIYPYEVLMQAMHDYDKSDINSQPARVMVLTGDGL